MPEIPVYWKFTSKDDILGFVSPDGELIAGKPATFATDASGNVTGLVGSGGDLVPVSYNKPILCIGGDHPYSQWNDGMAQMYLDAGVKPYIAINTTTLEEQEASDIKLDPVGAPRRLTYDQIRTMEGQGVEIVSHGHRHPTSWQRINTGIRIQYSGVNGTATVNIDANNLTLSAGSGENATLAISTYTTLATLAAAINAITNWTATIAPELTGEEPSKSMLRLNAARSVKTTAASQYFAAGGGLWFDWQPGSGSSYHTARGFVVRTTTGTAYLKVILGGVERIKIDLTVTSTLSGIRDAVNAAAISGLRCRLTDNQVDEVPRENYVQGDEFYSALPSGGSAYVLEIGHRPSVLATGLSQMYCVYRQMRRSKELLTEQGLTVTQLAQSGAYLMPTDIGAATDYEGVRVDPNSILSIYPYAMPIATLANSNWYPHFACLYASYPTAESLNAVVRAAIDSGAWYVNMLCHALLVDGSSGYPISNTDPTPYYDQTEANIYSFLQYLKPKINSGDIISPSPSKAQKFFSLARMPGNLLFNPRFQNSGASMNGKWNAGTGVGNLGTIVPGWHIASSASCFSSLVSVDDGKGDGVGKLKWTGIGVEGMMLASEILSSPGIYEFGCIAELDASAAGSGGYVYASARLNWGGYDKTRASDAGNTTSRIINAGANNLVLRFIIEPAIRELPAAFSNTGTFDLSVNNQLTLQFGGKTALSAVNVAGAIPAATTVGEIAAAINAALLASATYGYEYKDCAKVEQGRLVVRDVEFYDASSGLAIGVIINGNAASSIFGGDVWALAGTNVNASEITPVSIRILGSFTGNVSIYQPYCKKVSNL